MSTFASPMRVPITPTASLASTASAMLAVWLDRRPYYRWNQQLFGMDGASTDAGLPVELGPRHKISFGLFNGGSDRLKPHSRLIGLLEAFGTPLQPTVRQWRL